MKFEREYLLKADLREEIEEWISSQDICADRWDIEMLVEMIFYRLLHAGDLRESGRRKRKDYGTYTIGFTPRSLGMKVDADSPFKGEII